MAEQSLVWSQGRSIRRILVIRRKALGDALVTLPAVVQLAEAWPEAHIDLVVEQPFAQLFEAWAGRYQLLIWPPPDSARRGWIRRLRRNRYDLVFDYLGSPRTALWTALSGAPLRVGYDLPWRRWAYNVRVPRNRAAGVRLHEFAGEGFLDALRSLGLTPAPWHAAGARAPDPRLLGASYRAWSRNWRQRSHPRIGLMFSATWTAKAWPAQQACRLYAQLQDAGAAPLFITGPGDEVLARELREAAPQAEFAPRTDLLELADLFTSLDLFVGTDSGARHLAASLGLPTVTLFGPTDPRGWNPEDPAHVTVRTAEPCSPCNLTECPIPGHPCMTKLDADLVLAAVQEFWPRLVTRRQQSKGS